MLCYCVCLCCTGPQEAMDIEQDDEEGGSTHDDMEGNEDEEMEEDPFHDDMP